MGRGGRTRTHCPPQAPWWRPARTPRTETPGPRVTCRAGVRQLRSEERPGWQPAAQEQGSPRHSLGTRTRLALRAFAMKRGV